MFEENLKHDFPEPNDVGPCGLKEERSHDDHNGKGKDEHVINTWWLNNGHGKKKGNVFFSF